MPDTRENGNLDSRIRELVARAVADAPRPPEIDPSVLPESEPKHDHHRGWWLGGGAAILAAAALITSLLLVSGADDKVSTPATPPTVAPTPVPTTAAPTTVPPVAGPGAVLTAGPRGVVLHQGGERRTLTTEPMAIALDSGDGRVIVSRETGPGARRPLVLGDDGSLAPLFDDSLWPDDVRLHDIEVVDGRRLLLYGVQTAMDDPVAADETLYVIDLETQERTLVAEGISGWEFGTGRLHLATTGLIVGEEYGGVSRGIFIDDVPIPGQASALPTPDDLRLQESYSECGDCPRGFTVTSDGGTVAWIDRDELVVRGLDAEFEERTALSFSAACCGGLDLLEGTDSFVWSAEAWVEPAQAPTVIAADATTSPLEGVIATASPGGRAEPTPPPATTVPPPATPDASGVVLTAGPDGVVERRGGETRTLTTEPMTIALDSGDGRVIVARETGPGARRPLVLGEDGSLAPLFDYALWPNDVQLHDIEVVDGRRLLLYSEQIAMDDPESARETLYVIDLDTQERTLVARHIGGWEFGTDRLHLSRTGLIVGQASGEANHWIKILAVPDSPASGAALPTAADLGLEEFYFDCNDCPTGFTVAPGGGTIAWVDDGGLVSMALEPEIGQPVRIAEAPGGYVKDLDLSDSAAIVSIFQVPERPPLLIPRDLGDSVELEGTTATFGPTG